LGSEELKYLSGSGVLVEDRVRGRDGVAEWEVSISEASAHTHSPLPVIFRDLQNGKCKSSETLGNIQIAGRLIPDNFLSVCFLIRDVLCAFFDVNIFSFHF
jgi:hypothetical protein